MATIAVAAGSTDPGREFVHQLRLSFFAVVDAFRSVPPDRALWRELLFLALSTGAAVLAARREADGGRDRVSVAMVHHVALGLYMDADASGRVMFTHAQLAERVFRSRANVTRALQILEDLRIIRCHRVSRRSACIIELNLGGLSWDAVKRRGQRRERRRRERGQQPGSGVLPFSPAGDADVLREGLSGGTATPLSGGTTTPPLGYVQGLRTDTTTTAREGRLETEPVRPEPTARQRAYAADLGIDTAGVDGVELGERIERAEAARNADRSERRAARRSERRSDRPRRTAVEARRLAEAAACPSPGRVRNCPACRTLDRGADCHCESCGWSEPGCPHNDAGVTGGARRTRWDSR